MNHLLDYHGLHGRFWQTQKFWGAGGWKYLLYLIRHLLQRVSRTLFMDRNYGLRLLYRNILGLYLYWIGLEPLLRRKGVFPSIGKLFFGLLIALDSFLFGRLGMALKSELVWIHGLDTSGDICYLLYWLINYTLLEFIFLKTLVV